MDSFISIDTTSFELVIVDDAALSPTLCEEEPAFADLEHSYGGSGSGYFCVIA